MIINFNLKNYDCEYFEGSVYHQGACFSNGVYSKGNNGLTHVTYIFPRNTQKKLNYCFLDFNQLLEYFTNLSNILGFELISFCTKRTKYKLQIRCISEHRYFIYISTFIRYTWESPFNFLLYCALTNKSNFKNLNIIHIMQYYIALFRKGQLCHCLGDNNQTFCNFNVKCIFNTIRDDFNYNSIFESLFPMYIMNIILKRIETKQINLIRDFINYIANKEYEKHKKSLCCGRSNKLR